jgi:rhodanese-related sulfurtransferase
MSLCKYAAADKLIKMHQSDEIIIIDIREQEEFNREHIKNARCIPLSQLTREAIGDTNNKIVVFHCQIGNRTRQAEATFEALGMDEVILLENGIQAWKNANGPLVINIKTPLPIMRQVQIAVGFMVVLGIILAFLISPYFNLLSAFFGLGLLYAGISGNCGLAYLLMQLPYNKSNKL